jgi:hypothetical protein
MNLCEFGMSGQLLVKNQGGRWEMFKRRKSAEAVQLPPFAHYVNKKVAPDLAVRRDVILDTAAKSFPRGVGDRAVERGLGNYGHATSQLIALVFAAAIQDVRRTEIQDIEYGDCALAASFCMRILFCGQYDPIREIIDDWIAAFETDMRYLLYASDASVTDLLEAGNERFLHYEGDGGAIMPDAYLYLLAKVLGQREGGEWEPYSALDPMLAPDPIVLPPCRLRGLRRRRGSTPGFKQFDLFRNWRITTVLKFGGGFNSAEALG